MKINYQIQIRQYYALYKMSLLCNVTTVIKRFLNLFPYNMNMVSVCIGLHRIKT